MARYDTVDYMTLVLKGGRGDMSCAGRGGRREKRGRLRSGEKERRKNGMDETV